ncbi:hypothetical protein ASF98_07745 [Arthrobacter sp. Leaf337]|uniref:hypothetical protein n=1 Tax=Arthrobacter sp. Leaf337 TaxID=1736342 RepID=UPI0006F97EDF|nr:hypothetical protein [Arthrobacter sp. Leaf337]KQR68529.1 hypothetical protein ASF98_07745 [Arthrobacter sp. Leaf337]
MNAAAGRPNRILVVILAIIGVLAVAALAVVFSRGEPALLDESTPQGVVQRYSAAVIDGDEAAATAYLTETARTQCVDFERSSTENLRVTLVSTTERASSADVRVLMVVSNGSGPFGNSEYETEDVFDLVKTDGKWLIDSAPWQLRVCTNRGVKP